MCGRILCAHFWLVYLWRMNNERAQKFRNAFTSIFLVSLLYSSWFSSCAFPGWRNTHTHILGIYRFLSTTFFSVLFCLFPLFFVQVIWREEGKPRMDRFRWIHHRVLHVGKRSVVYQTHTHTQVKDGLGCCCPSLCVVVSEPDGGGRKPWERPARRDRNIYALASEVSFVIECTTEHPVRFLSFLFFS